ncbi:MAG TPA: energy transducer TonB [Sphingomonas sp.]|nr:energy transducer TonB [Sphingomonas sp.]
MLLMTAQAAAPSPTPSPLAPAGKWTVDYSPTGCTLSRDFAYERETMVFGFRPTPLMANGDISLISTGGEVTRAPHGTGKLILMPMMREMATRWVSGPLTDGRNGVLFRADDKAFWDALPQATDIRLEFERGTPITLTLGPMDKAVAGVRTCADSLLRHWGVDPSAMVGGHAETPFVAKWFNNNDYPAEARRQGKQGRVHAVATFDRTGAVIECRVVASSGVAALDNKTCDLVRLRGRVPAAGAGEADVRFLYMPVRWAI